MADDITTDLRWPFDRENPLEPPQEYARRRSSCPISKVALWGDQEAWLLTRYGDIRAALRDARLSADSSAENFPAPSRAIAMARKVQRSFVRLDGAAHARQRNLLSKYFTVKHIEGMREVIESKVEELLDTMAGAEASGVVDLVQHLSLPLPIYLTCYLLNLPEEDAPFLLDRVMEWMNADSEPDQSAKAADDIIDYFAKAIEREKVSPTAGMVRDLVHDHVLEGHITEDEALWMLHLLLVGGFDTAANMISLGALTLMQNPDEIEKMLADPERVPRVVEELLRIHSVAHFTANRMALEDVEIDGQLIAKGEGIVAPLPAANHDPEVFSDPTSFCPDRSGRAHLAFGFGPHQCLGQPIARLELNIVFARLFERFPGMRLAVPEDTLHFHNAMIYGLKELPVSL